MIRVQLAAEDQDARLVKSFYGRAREVLASGFDHMFYEPEGREMYPLIPKDAGASPESVLAMFGEQIAEMEYLACFSIKNHLSPGILGLITERHLAAGEWVLKMIRRQREIRATGLSGHMLHGEPGPPQIQAILQRPDQYDRYGAAILQARSRTVAHRLLEDFE